MTAGARYADDAITALDHAPELRVAGRLDDVLDRARVAARESGAETDRAVAGASFAAAATPFGIAVSVLGSLLVGIAIYGPGGGTPGGMTPMALAILVLLPLSAFEAAAMMPAAAVALSRARVASSRVMGDARRVRGRAPACRVGGPGRRVVVRRRRGVRLAGRRRHRTRSTSTWRRVRGSRWSGPVGWESRRC